MYYCTAYVTAYDMLCYYSWCLWLYLVSLLSSVTRYTLHATTSDCLLTTISGVYAIVSRIRYTVVLLTGACTVSTVYAIVSCIRYAVSNSVGYS